MQLLLKIAEDQSTPLYKRVSDAIRSAIVEGTVAPGQPLPSSRQLAQSMKLSRMTITRSYEDLAGQGWILILERGKTVVSRDVKQLVQKSALDLFKSGRDDNQIEPRWSSFAERLQQCGLVVDPSDPVQSYGAASVKELPVTLWKQCVNTAARKVASELMLREYNLGYMPLRYAVQGLLARSRGVQCAVSEVVVHGRSAGGIDLLCRLLLETGDSVAVEDPGSELVRALFGTHGLRIEAVPVDERGLRVDDLKKLKKPPKLLYVCPSRHDPSGVAMDLERRKELLEWAADNCTFILEDDFDCEYRYDEKPIPSLQSLDKSGLVIYRYNFWKAMYPLVRLAVNVLPPKMVPVLSMANNMLYRDVPLVEQAALAEFINAGHFERHIQRRYKQCATRRAALFAELHKNFGQKVRIDKVTSGTEARLVFDSDWDTGMLLQAADAAELPLVSTAPKYLTAPPVQNEFTLNFSNLSESRIAALLEKFRRELDGFLE